MFFMFLKMCPDLQRTLKVSVKFDPLLILHLINLRSV